MKETQTETEQKGGLLRRIFGRPQTAAPTLVREEAAAPAAHEIAMNPNNERTGKRLPKAKTVLMIMSSDPSAKRWKRELQEWGYGVELMESGEKALKTLYEVAFDAVLLDSSAKGIDGREVLRLIRAQDELKGLFVGYLVLEKDGGAESEVAALDAGATRAFSRENTGADEILTALKTALFPRTMQVKPRGKSAAPAPGAPVQSSASESESRPAIRMSESLDAPVQNAQGSVKKLLIIDADENIAGMYRSQIEAAGYEVEVALDGETGFHDLYKTNPDALLLDLLLPGDLSGSEILKKTRAQKKFEKIPILVFTNIYTRDVEEEARNAGVLQLFNKAAATPRNVIDALNEIFLPSSAMLGANAPVSIRFDGRGAAPADGAAAPAAAGASPAARKATDNDFQAEIRESLLQSAPEYVKTLRGLLQVLLRSQSDPAAQSTQLLELYSRVHSLTANAAIAGFDKVARLAGALEAMLREFQARPEGLNASTRRTLTQAMDFLALLFTSAATHESGAAINEQILVVDDEIISRRVIGHSLEKAGLKSTAVSHPDEALKLLESQPYDLIFLDVEMPGMNGFDLCKRLRTLPFHAKTPVLFVTALSGFESRAKSSLSGGDDFIGKPFSYIELAVKALIHVLRGAIEKAGHPAGAPPALAAPAGVAAGSPVVPSAPIPTLAGI